MKLIITLFLCSFCQISMGIEVYYPDEVNKITNFFTSIEIANDYDKHLSTQHFAIKDEEWKIEAQIYKSRGSLKNLIIKSSQKFFKTLNISNSPENPLSQFHLKVVAPFINDAHNNEYYSAFSLKVGKPSLKCALSTKYRSLDPQYTSDDLDINYVSEDKEEDFDYYVLGVESTKKLCEFLKILYELDLLPFSLLESVSQHLNSSPLEGYTMRHKELQEFVLDTERQQVQ